MLNEQFEELLALNKEQEKLSKMNESAQKRLLKHKAKMNAFEKKVV